MNIEEAKGITIDDMPLSERYYQVIYRSNGGDWQVGSFLSKDKAAILNHAKNYLSDNGEMKLISLNLPY